MQSTRAQKANEDESISQTASRRLPDLADQPHGNAHVLGIVSASESQRMDRAAIERRYAVILQTKPRTCSCMIVISHLASGHCQNTALATRSCPRVP
jgi:hypothetical protein